MLLWLRLEVLLAAPAAAALLVLPSIPLWWHLLLLHLVQLRLVWLLGPVLLAAPGTSPIQEQSLMRVWLRLRRRRRQLPAAAVQGHGHAALAAAALGLCVRHHGACTVLAALVHRSLLRGQAHVPIPKLPSPAAPNPLCAPPPQLLLLLLLLLLTVMLE